MANGIILRDVFCLSPQIFVRSLVKVSQRFYTVSFKDLCSVFDV